MLENTAFKVVTFPSMTPTPEHFEEAMWSIDQRPMAMNRVSELGEAIQREHDELVPRIVGASISRMIARAIGAAGADAGARAAVGGAGGEVLGLLAGLAVEGTLVALDRPDTRSWTLLPERVWMGRARLPAGEHRVELQVRGPGGDQTVRRDVDLAPGGFVVLDLTTLR